MPDTLHNPAVQISSNQLRVTRKQIERQIQLRGIEFSDKIQKALSNSYALVIWQDNEAADTKEVSSHSHMRNCDKSYGLFLVEGDVASDAGAKVSV